MKTWLRGLAWILLLSVLSPWALANGIGKVKVVSGEVEIERSGQHIPATVGADLLQSDRIVTGSHGSVGMLFNDDSRLSLGPNSAISLDKFDFNYANHDGHFNVGMTKGTLSVISGKSVQKSPGALKVQTPSAILAVRGTEFSVKVEESR